MIRGNYDRDWHGTPPDDEPEPERDWDEVVEERKLREYEPKITNHEKSIHITEESNQPGKDTRS